MEFLKNRINDEMSLENIVNVFEEMCDIPVEEDMILFETGTFSFTGEPLFYFMLVRQFPRDDDEFYQIEVNILYKPDSENEVLNELIWNEDLIGSIFDYIKNSKAYAYAKNQEYVKTDIYLAET